MRHMLQLFDDNGGVPKKINFLWWVENRVSRVERLQNGWLGGPSLVVINITYVCIWNSDDSWHTGVCTGTVCACSHEHYCRYRKHSRTLRVPSMQGIWRVVINITYYVCIWNTDDSWYAHVHMNIIPVTQTFREHSWNMWDIYVHVFRTFGDNCRTLMNMTAHRKWTYMYKHSKNITETWGYNKRTKHRIGYWHARPNGCCFVPCRCATFSSRRNATTLFNFETLSCWRVAYNLGTCFMNGLGDQNLNRVCCLCSFAQCMQFFPLHDTEAHKLLPPDSKNTHKTAPFSQWVLIWTKPSFLFSFHS